MTCRGAEGSPVEKGSARSSRLMAHCAQLMSEMAACGSAGEVSGQGLFTGSGDGQLWC